MLVEYPACFFKEKNGYSVVFPDLNYLATNGETLNQALSMAADCLAGYLYWFDKSGETRPEPSAISVVNPEDMAKEFEFEYIDCFVKLITANTAEKTCMIEIPESAREAVLVFLKSLKQE